MSVVKIDLDNKVRVPEEVLERLGAKPGDLVEAKFEHLVDVVYTDEPLDPDAKEALREAREDVKEGRVSGPFDSAKEAIRYLRNSPPEEDAHPS